MTQDAAPPSPHALRDPAPRQHTPPGTGDPILIVDRVSKVYEIYKRPIDRLARFFGRRGNVEEFTALRELSITLPRGAAVGVLGPNGAGKSTLLQLICSTVAPTTGAVHMGGRAAALLELGAGFDPELSGRENVRLYGSVLGLSAEQIDARFDEIVDFSELREFIDRPVKTYSSGMFVRLAFSVAIHVDPDLLVIDEALAVGDGRFAQRCAARIRELRERGVSLLFVSHDIEAVRRLCDEALVLHRGEVVQRGDAAHVANWYLAFLNAGFDLDALAEAERRAALAEAEPAAQPAAEPAVESGPPAQPPAPEPSASVAPARPAHAIDAGTEPESDIPEFSRYRSGDGAARVTAAYFIDRDGTHNHRPTLGEPITLVIECRYHAEMPAHVVGFYLRDRLGTDVIGLNSHHEGHEPAPVRPGDRRRFRFRFDVALRPGDYGLTIAIADTPESPAFHDYIENAAVLHVAETHPPTRVFGMTLPSGRAIAVDELDPAPATPPGAARIPE